MLEDKNIVPSDPIYELLKESKLFQDSDILNEFDFIPMNNEMIDAIMHTYSSLDEINFSDHLLNYNDHRINEIQKSAISKLESFFENLEERHAKIITDFSVKENILVETAILETIEETKFDELFTDGSNERHMSIISKLIVGLLSATYGQNFDGSEGKKKLVYAVLLQLLILIGANLLNTTIEKIVYPDKDDQVQVIIVDSNYTKEQIDRSLDLKEREIKLKEN